MEEIPMPILFSLADHPARAAKLRPWLLRCVLLCIVILGFGRCAPDMVAVLVRVKNLPTGIGGLQVSATLDDKPALQVAEFTQQLDQFVVTVPKSAIVDGHLVVEITGVDEDRCKLSQKSRIDTTVSPNIAYSEVEVSLVQLAETLCTMTVDVIGDGIVTPSPVGVLPDKLGIACKIPGPCDYPKSAGQVVTLTSGRGGSPFVTNWGPSCPGQSYAASSTCTVTLAPMPVN